MMLRAIGTPGRACMISGAGFTDPAPPRNPARVDRLSDVNNK